MQQQLGFGTAGRVGPGGGAPKHTMADEEVVKFARPALDMPDDKVGGRAAEEGSREGKEASVRALLVAAYGAVGRSILGA